MVKGIGASTGQLSELLGPASQYSHLVGKIQTFFGWEPVRGATPITLKESGTIRYLVERADAEQQQYLLDACNMLLRAPSAEATKALTAMLRAFRTSFDPLRDLGVI